MSVYIEKVAIWLDVTIAGRTDNELRKIELLRRCFDVGTEWHLPFFQEFRWLETSV